MILAGYLGKKSDMIVHHLAELKPESNISKRGQNNRKGDNLVNTDTLVIQMEKIP